MLASAINPFQTPLLTMTQLEEIQHQLNTRIKARPAAQVPSHYDGYRPSPLRGQSLELSDNRPYQPGDDIRHINWRVTARSGKATSKVYAAEKQAQQHLVIDRTTSMFFASRGELKATVAVRIAAFLTFFRLAHHEPTAGTLVNGHNSHHASSKALPKLLNFLGLAAAAMPPTDATHEAWNTQLLHDIAHRTQQGTAIYLISDFAWLQPENIAALTLLSQRFSVYAIQVIDPAEETLLNVGKIRLRSASTGKEQVINTGHPSLRDHYKKAMMAYHLKIKSHLTQAGVSHHKIYTHQNTLRQLTAFLQ